MDSESLRTASNYLNNLLLTRGLLRDPSAPVDFVKPSKDSRAQIINLVHDLVLRSDRDKDARETLSFSVRQLRAEDARQKAEIERLQAKVEENARSAVAAQNAERTAVEERKRVEKVLKGAQDQVVKLKTSLAQVKAQCANDIRKRDLELARLRSHLQGQQRGNKAVVVAPSVTVTGRLAKQQSQQSKAVDDPEYSLEQESAEFLTRLSQSLSDENDGLISLLRDALESMKEVLGLPARTKKLPDSAIGSRGSSDEVAVGGHDSMMHALPTSYETLATGLEDALTHMKRILTNPNFVSVEEVEARDDEIVRLRQGWEHMEMRWKDLLIMMNSWQRRMHTGDTINIDDLRRGMGLVSPQRGQTGNGAMQHVETDQSFAGSDASEVEAIELDNSKLDESSMLVLEPPRLSDSLAAISATKRKRDVLEPPHSFDLRPPGSAAIRSPARKMPVPVMQPDYADGEDDYAEPLPEDEPSEQISEQHMTVHEKLDAVAREAADAQAARARAQASPQALPSASRKVQYSPTALDCAVDQDDAELQDDDTLGKIFSPVKRTRIRGRAKRRKSTLSRDELAELLEAAGGEE
ncbi:hypothetical protein B0A48_03588 [Cryoendolithus antarcticus]|uniref:Afadin and alpha-actinin-binding-domain-containing protein n=1 Tax=Cryoendolithus antarcticus TaxID=1507870 RepID=A0A1V8TKS7_9PEZI|nr:hypothetical protein B0A48_03588 [Cryoendolithus antarcticus]